MDERGRDVLDTKTDDVEAGDLSGTSAPVTGATVKPINSDCSGIILKLGLET